MIPAYAGGVTCELYTATSLNSAHSAFSLSNSEGYCAVLSDSYFACSTSLTQSQSDFGQTSDGS